MTAFGEHVRQLRLARNETLRRFCLTNDYDPGNISKIERGILSPPQSGDALNKYAKALGLIDKTPEWVKFHDLAADSNGMIPALSSDALIKKLPLFLRTLDNKDLDEEKLNKIIEFIKTA